MLEDIIYTLLSTDYKKDIIPILFTNKSLYNNIILWNKIVNMPVGKRNFTLLMYFAVCNNYKRVKFLLESGANVNLQDGKKFSVLLYALGASVDKSGVHVCSKCNLKIIEELCKYKINLNLLDNNSDNCIFIAIKLKYSAALNILLNYDFNINHKNNNNYTVMSLAIYYLNFDACYKLWKKGADINSVDNDNHSFLMCAIMTKQSDEIIEEILKNKVDVNIVTIKQGYSALMYAILKSSIYIIKLLIVYGADVNKIDNKETSTLMFAIKENNIEIIKFLCDNKVDIKYKGSNNLDAIYIARKCGYKDIENELKKRLKN